MRRLLRATLLKPLLLIGLLLCAAAPAVAQLPGGGSIAIGAPVIGGTNGNCLYVNGSVVGNQSCAAGVGVLPAANGGTGVANASTLTWSGFNLVFGLTGSTSVFLPTSGTLAILGANTFTGAQSAPSFSTTGAVTYGAPVAGGSVPTPSGSCPVNTQTGGNTAGTFKANGACAAGTVILTFASTAPAGWSCKASDMTTPADAVNQTASSTTTATFTGTMATLDVVAFSCTAY